ncbi:hypothetical protein [Hymenobacter properus]|uniref:Lipocalin-like domain-containing protein n=1 Tax=Hymenobacter properus TaxID=2791026 RepID=A0A931FKR1_9BACT|nr:hypothetical protein [Hymenobacter properus]MBF9143353.1 hypothetical protein [Hymenobacter properus]MBR7722163.1 hypothetical protein [Microvirga sp. SRT04]
MNTPLRLSLLLSLVAGLGLASCAPVDEEATPHHEGLAGNWRLVHRQCYCVPGPPPNETATFTDTNYTFFKNNQSVSSGTYSAASVKACGIPTPAPGLRLVDATLGPREAIITLRGDSLVLNYGGPCDAPVDTYLRLP